MDTLVHNITPNCTFIDTYCRPLGVKNFKLTKFWILGLLYPPLHPSGPNLEWNCESRPTAHSSMPNFTRIGWSCRPCGATKSPNLTIFSTSTFCSGAIQLAVQRQSRMQCTTTNLLLSNDVKIAAELRTTEWQQYRVQCDRTYNTYSISEGKIRIIRIRKNGFTIR